MSTLSKEALKVSITQIGKKENPIGSNWGNDVKIYLNSVGLNFPASWCMAFVYYCYNVAATNLKAKNTAIKSAGVLDVWNKVDPALKASTPSIGSVFIMSFGRGLGHTGIVEKFDSQFIYTIEGNTNDTGSREGYEVCRRKRLRSKIKGYINY